MYDIIAICLGFFIIMTLVNLSKGVVILKDNK